MITLRSLAIAFIFNEDKLLLMHRSLERKFAPGLWAAVGGHIEPAEMNNPQDACYREIEEETGLNQKDISNLNLKYIVMRKSANEIRIQYVYFCGTDKTDLKQSPEGTLHWIQKKDILNREMSATTKMILLRYLNENKNPEKIEVGTVDCYDGKPIINWCGIEDWNPNSFK